MDCILVIEDEVNIRFLGLSPETRRKLVKAVEYQVPGAKFSPAVRLGRWNGISSFADIGGRSYLNLLDKLLPIVEADGYNIEIEDKRAHHDFVFDQIDKDSYKHVIWPAGHVRAGESVSLREHQVDMVNAFITEIQSINVCPTSGGKAQPLYSKIKIPGGWSTIGEIDRGDMVVTQSGVSAEVIGVYPQGVTPTYTVTFMDGRSCDASEDHLWTVYDNSVELIRSTKELLGSIDKYGIPLCIPESIPDIQIAPHADMSDAVMMYMGASYEQKIAFLSETLCTQITTDSSYTYRCTCVEIALLLQKLAWSMGFIAHVHGECLVIDTASKTLGISSIVYKGDLETKCIMIDDEAQLYVTDNYIVTHNTIVLVILSEKVQKYGRSIVIVPSKDLVVQTEKDYRNFGLDVGVIYGDRKEFDRRHTICTWQSLEAMNKRKDGSLDDFLKDVVCVISDECHLSKAAVLKALLAGPCKHIPIRWGLTGTLPKEENDRMTLLSTIGPVSNTVKAVDLQDKGYMANVHIHIRQMNDLSPGFPDYAAEYKWLTTNQKRLVGIVNNVSDILEQGNTLILVNNIATGEALAGLIDGAIFLNGSVKSVDRLKEYKNVNSTSNITLICTFGIASTGLDLPHLTSLIMIESGKAFTRVIQSIGRVLRITNQKDFANVYDICSVCKYSKRHLTQRKAYYNESGYPFSITKVNY